ncbi:MAG: TonB family protein [Bacteroidales bacterium]|nr:TonB family protein [Bacteroidales bacterium]
MIRKIALIALLLSVFLSVSAQEYKEYYENGQIRQIGKFSNGKATGEWKIYYENGQLSIVGNFSEGRTIGEWKFYHENGQLSCIGNSFDSLQTVEWKYYYIDGKLEDDNNKSDEEAQVWAEQMPAFPGGEAALKVFIAENIIFPESDYLNNLHGTVFVRFVVGKTGKVGDILVTRGVDPLFDAEAVRVVKLLPDFIPGVQGGKPVNVWFSMPINFQLNN